LNYVISLRAITLLPSSASLEESLLQNFIVWILSATKF